MITRLSPDIANFVSLQELDVSHNGMPMYLSPLFYFISITFCCNFILNLI